MSGNNRENSKNYSTAGDRATTDLSTHLLKGLTLQEIAQLIDALFEVIPSEFQEQAIAQLPPATQQTVRQILASPSTNGKAITSESQTVSLAKQAQTWSKLWKNWDATVMAASEEEGQYMDGENDWEPPYFDSIAFIEDLEVVAGKMLPLLQTAFEHDFTPDRSFISELIEAESEISSSLADWMPPIDEMLLDWQITECALQWEWLATRQQEEDAFNFVQKIRQSEREFQAIKFDDDTVVEFLKQLSGDDRQNIFIGLIADKETVLWEEVLTNPYSYWHDFYLELIQQYAPDRYVATLRETIPQRWQNGLPAIESLLAENNYAESLVAIEETLRSLLKSDFDSWAPEKSLIVANSRCDRTEYRAIDNLLSYYQQTARGLNRIELSNVLELQQIALDRGLNWSAMFGAFADIQVAESTRKSLFKSWYNYIDLKSKFGIGSGYFNVKDGDNWWVMWLIDSIIDPQKGDKWFGEKITQWLGGLPEDKTKLGAEYDRLRLLTRDLTDIQYGTNAIYPQFYRVVICPSELSTENDLSRHKYLRQYAPADLLERVMNYWKTNLQNFVPKPELAQKSNYYEHSRWMVALKEISPHNYNTLLTQWRVAHQRRSNLWKAMKEAGLN